MKSGFLKLNLQDLLKGAIVFLITSVLHGILTFTEAGHLPTTAEALATIKVSLIATVGYLAKNLLTNSDDKFAKKD